MLPMRKHPYSNLNFNADGKVFHHTILAKAQINDEIKIQLKAVGGNRP